eukprot:GEMP01012485.1.p1 GENE.GEMP01012485.1~~GEMP01012485.1.p1  ORF type:complete len:611 (+),score=154.65 GEMP01012485.1:162-1994(+)
MRVVPNAALGERLQACRSLLTKHSLGAYIVPHTDAHFSEYLCARDFRVQYLSGFDGSAGTCVVTHDEALLWTDGRYFTQAVEQLGDGWTLMKDRMPETPTVTEWLKQWQRRQSVTSEHVGVDPMLFSHDEVTEYKKELVKGSVKLEKQNLVDAIWEDQPARPRKPIRRHPDTFSGMNAKAKIEKLQKAMSEKATIGCLVSALDEIAWMLNLRGSDIDYNPVFFAYLWVPVSGRPVLFTDGARYKGFNDADVKPYGAIHSFSFPTKVWLDVKSTPRGISQRMEETHEERLPIAKWKGIKNEAELEGMRQAHVRDGVAKTKWIIWLFENWRSQTEVSAATKLEEWRGKQDRFVGLSFPSISGMGANAAVIHYHPTGTTPLTADAFYLIDSGAQYYDGTTDVTRTLHFGEPTAEMKENYTRVLKGHIGLGDLIFPPNTPGPAIDCFARQHLWRAGLEYSHGTGHGVGAALNVHEGPMGISHLTSNFKRFEMLSHGLEAGMIVSNEPGYYKPGEYGIRIENLVEVQAAKTKNNFMDRTYLQFRNLTMVPIQKSIIDQSLLSPEEIDFLDNYHRVIYENLRPYFHGKELEALKEMTKGLNEQDVAESAVKKRKTC